MKHSQAFWLCPILCPDFVKAAILLSFQCTTSACSQGPWNILRLELTACAVIASLEQRIRNVIATCKYLCILYFWKRIGIIPNLCHLVHGLITCPVYDNALHLRCWQEANRYTGFILIWRLKKQSWMCWTNCLVPCWWGQRISTCLHKLRDHKIVNAPSAHVT